ncbi:MAG: hypothetical protein LQ352_007259 [Teloschistes flavicans]|nr:MAG: hypothetical protein LQ352_007259 [Teloschistes flavicans]
MRLLQTETLQFKEFFDTNIPKYAILSHRWDQDEVSFKQMRKGQAPEGLGLTKLRNFCLQARTDGYEWAWMDTCCIDQKSSAELSEAINSMFRWYRNAERCYVYLADVNERLVEDDRSFHPRTRTEILASSWFRRGWTLQELLAPQEIIFYDAQWRSLGDKYGLHPLIEEATGIAPIYLHQPDRCCKTYDRKGPSAATKMSWAARRETSRSEDMAYCLLGLFDINMPLLYGEGGAKAFRRLQTEIISKQVDESIFAWKFVFDPRPRYAGILAPHPRFFIDSDTVIPNYNYDLRSLGNDPRYWMTNKGLAMKCPAGVSLKIAQDFAMISNPLNCRIGPCRISPERSDSDVRIIISKFDGKCYRVRDSESVEDFYNLDSAAQDPADDKIIYFALEP